MSIRLLCALALALSIQPCGAAGDFDAEAWAARVAGTSDVEVLARALIDLSVEFDPVEGTQLGLHGTAEDPVRYDSRLPDYSAQAFADYYARLVFFRDRLAALDTVAMDRNEQIDHHILSKQVDLELFELGELRGVTQPLGYAGTVGSALNELVLRDYAPLEQRLGSFGERCRALPGLLRQAWDNLAAPHVRPTALEKQLMPGRLDGLIAADGLLVKVLDELIAQSTLGDEARRTLRADCDSAIRNIRSFATWFTETMAIRPDGEWRLGPTLYEQKYALYMDYPLGPQELLAEAEKALEDTHARLVELAREVHDSVLEAQIAAGKAAPSATLDDGAVVRAVLAVLAEDRSSLDTLIADSYALADAIVGFVREHDLMDLPPTSKLRIENIPAHLSGAAVAMIQTAPPFEPQLESVWFWDLPLLAKAESYLKEYNRPVLAEVYIHEGVPGHFVQLEYSNNAPRLVPRVFLNGPMVEGWASYIQTQMVDQGFTVYPDRQLGRELQKIANLKLQLRTITNAIIDIRLHTTDWPEEQAVRLMIDKGFQEEGEARGKLNRAKLSSVQLSSYFAGHHAIKEILAEYQRFKGDAFTWKEFNERLVGAGSPPFFAVREHMLSEQGAGGGE